MDKTHDIRSNDDQSMVSRSQFVVLAHYFSSQGANLDTVLSKYSFDLDDLSTIPDFVPFTVELEILEAAWQESKDSNVVYRGFLAPELIKYGPVYAMVDSADTLGAGLVALIRYEGLYLTCFEVQLHVLDDIAYLTFQMNGQEGAPHRQFNEFIASSYVNIIRSAAGPDWAPEEVYFSHDAPAKLNPSECFFNSPVYYSSLTCMIVFDSVSLDCPMPDCNHIIHNISKEDLERGINDSCRGNRFTNEVAAFILDFFYRQNPVDTKLPITRVAEMLKTNVKNLQRKLLANKVSYSGLLAYCRFVLAVHCLINTDLSVTGISHKLGYTEISSFERAFRRSTMMTPSQFRKAHLRSPHA